MHFREDFLGGFGPHEGSGMGIALGDVRLNSGNQFRDAAEYTATNLFGRQVAKDPFDQIEP